MEKNQETRNSNMEILRIIFMIMIVLSHFFLYTGIYNTHPYMGIIFGSFGNLGVNIFVLISSYYLVKSDFKFKKIFKLWFQVFLYSVIIGGACLLSNCTEFNERSILKMFAPISYSQYWFASTYMFLYFIFPFLNKFINRLSQKEYKILLIILTLLLSMVYSVILKSNFFDADGPGTFTWFVYLYLCGGYIRLYNIPYFNDKTKNIIILLLLFITLYFASILLYAFSKSFYFYKLNSIFMVGLAISMFYLFINIKPKFSKMINNIGKFSFSVYLINENPYIRTKLCTKMDEVYNNIKV